MTPKDEFIEFLSLYLPAISCEDCNEVMTEIKDKMINADYFDIIEIPIVFRKDGNQIHISRK